MALPGNNNSISLSQIQTEFGGTDPISLTEYYRGGSYTTDNNTNVPTTGEISMSDFFGAQDMFFLTISSNTADFALSRAALDAGWTRYQPLSVTINSGVYIYGSTDAVAFTINGDFSKVIVNNYGYILGRGGAGGATGQNGLNGGYGIYNAEQDVEINNYSGAFICGGGGGGAGGSWGGGGGGAGGGAGGRFTYDGGGNGGAGGAPGQKGSNGASRLGYGYGAGGEAGGQGGSSESNPGTDDAGAGGGGGRIVPGADVRVNSGGDNSGWGGTGAGGHNDGGYGSGRAGGGGGGWAGRGGSAANGRVGGSGGYAIWNVNTGSAQITNEGTIYASVYGYSEDTGIKDFVADEENEYDADGVLV